MMSAAEPSPRLLKGGFVTLDASTGAITRILPFQYNPQQVVHAVGGPNETFSLVAQYDAADGLETGDATVAQQGIGPQLAALRAVVLADRGSLLAFVWGPARVTPVRILSLTITETAFDTHLHPLAATATLELRVEEGASDGIAARLAQAYEREQAQLAGLVPAGTLDELGITGLG